MRRNILIIFCLFITLDFACAQSAKSKEAYFHNLDGCFLLYNMKTNQFEETIGSKRCKERLPACSTFKVALAVMAFDSGVLKDENQVFQWDGKQEAREVANHDQTPKTWIKDSIVWVSQRITPQIGQKRLKKYLQMFQYGNEDMSAGITQAWLIKPDSKGPALRISAYEQVRFMKNLWSGKLSVSSQAIALTKDLTYLETSFKGFRLNGKTGSNSYIDDNQRRLGWFIAHIDNGQKEYIAVTNFSDRTATTESSYGGTRAKEITKQILSDKGLW